MFIDGIIDILLLTRFCYSLGPLSFKNLTVNPKSLIELFSVKAEKFYSLLTALNNKLG